MRWGYVHRQTKNCSRDHIRACVSKYLGKKINSTEFPVKIEVNCKVVEEEWDASVIYGIVFVAAVSASSSVMLIGMCGT